MRPRKTVTRRASLLTDALRRAALGLTLFLLLAQFLLTGCQDRADVLALSSKAGLLWEQGQYMDAARNFVTLSEIYSSDPLAEDSLFWAANLYQHFLQDVPQAIRYYQTLLVQYPGSRFSAETQENLAALFEEDKGTRHRALQIYQQLLLNKKLSERRDEFHFKISLLNLRMGRLDQARFEFRTLMEKYPRSTHIPKTYYLVGYSYFLEKRFPLALVAFNQVVKDFPGTQTAIQAQYFVADTLEELGNLKEALRTFRALKGKYSSDKILEKRIKSLRSRMKKGVR